MGTVMRRSSPLHVVLVAAAIVLLIAGVFLSPISPAAIEDLGWVALGLAIIVAAALVGGNMAARIGQPAVLGELVAGILLGNLPGLGALQFIGADRYLDILAQVGMLLLLFDVGLDLSVRDLFAVGPSSLLVAVLGTVGTLTIGTGAATLFMSSAPMAARVFVGAAITATSIGITARVMKDMGASRSAEARIVLGAAVVDDVLALVVLGVVTASIGSAAAGFQSVQIIGLVMKTVGFLTAAIVLGSWWTPVWFRQAANLKTNGALLAIGLCFCFVLSWAATTIGLAALVGAFAAGLVLEDSHSEAFVQRGERPLGELLEPMTAFLVPVFFVLVGFRTNIRVLLHPALLTFAAALSVAAIVGKLACGLGVLTRGARRLSVAFGMMPRGEVALVFAALGGSLRVGGAPLLDEREYAAIVAVVVVTTLVTPPALKWSLRVGSSSRGLTRPAA
jgi:Kef-type K+ transport system membrane component KefB